MEKYIDRTFDDLASNVIALIKSGKFGERAGKFSAEEHLVMAKQGLCKGG